MSGTDHKHPTFGVCECGHLDFMHPWTSGERVDYQGACINLRRKDDGGFDWDGPKCGCAKFHADPIRVSP